MPRARGAADEGQRPVNSDRSTAWVVVGALLFAAGVAQSGEAAPAGDGGCVAQVRQHPGFDLEQLRNATVIAKVGVEMGMPERAVVVALATAMQESGLRNLPHLGADNDHDSLGLFQQRHSQGWGTEEQISDPRYASERFYLALRDVAGWEGMRVTDAAQAVQRSALPEAYQQWADGAAGLADKLVGGCG